MLFLCDELGKFEHEVLALSLQEYARLLAYYRYKVKIQKEANRGSKIRSLPGGSKSSGGTARKRK